MIILVPLISSLLGWRLDFEDAIHPVDESANGDGALKSKRYEVTLPIEQIQYLDQTLRR